MKRTGGYGGMPEDQTTLNNIIKKKKILQSTNIIAEKEIKLHDFINSSYPGGICPTENLGEFLIA